MTALLQVRDVHKTYPRHDEPGRRVVLDDLSLTVSPGDVVCLIGSSGSGKSTLLRCLDLLEPIDDGVIEFQGREISDPLVDPRVVRHQGLRLLRRGTENDRDVRAAAVEQPLHRQLQPGGAVSRARQSLRNAVLGSGGGREHDARGARDG